MKKYNVIFLDFDGVLNSHNWFDSILRKHEDKETYYRTKETSVGTLFSEGFLASIKYDSARSKVNAIGDNLSIQHYNKLLKIMKNIENPAIVLSTSWRHGFNTEAWQEIFNQLPGWKYPILGRTPDIIQTDIDKLKILIQANHVDYHRYDPNDPYRILEKQALVNQIEDPNRGAEIASYLAEHYDRIERYCILDDDADFLQRQMPHFFRTDRKLGLTNRLANTVIKYFNTPIKHWSIIEQHAKYVKYHGTHEEQKRIRAIMKDIIL